MRRAGIAAWPHGFRSTFRTWAQERGENWEASEISLSHRVCGSVAMSYARSDLIEMRRAPMERYGASLFFRSAICVRARPDAFFTG